MIETKQVILRWKTPTFGIEVFSASMYTQEWDALAKVQAKIKIASGNRWGDDFPSWEISEDTEYAVTPYNVELKELFDKIMAKIYEIQRTGVA